MRDFNLSVLWYMQTGSKWMAERTNKGYIYSFVTDAFECDGKLSLLEMCLRVFECVCGYFAEAFWCLPSASNKSAGLVKSSKLIGYESF